MLLLLIITLGAIMIVITPNGHRSPWPPPEMSICISRYSGAYQEDSHHNAQVCLHIPEVLEIDSPSPDRSWLQKLVHSLHYGLRNSKTPWFYCSGEQWMLVEKVICVESCPWTSRSRRPSVSITFNTDDVAATRGP